MTEQEQLLASIDVSEEAKAYFSRLLEQQGDDMHIRLSTVNGGTPAGDVQLGFAESSELDGDHLGITLDEAGARMMWVATDSLHALAEARLDYVRDGVGGELTIKAPNLRGAVPTSDDPITDQVEYWLAADINPMLASHGGMVQLQEVTPDNDVVLRFGGGCHGCGMVDVTLKGGIEKTLREKIPAIGSIVDATDHASGTDPYYKPEGW